VQFSVSENILTEKLFLQKLAKSTLQLTVTHTALHSNICTRLFHGKMHCDWFHGVEIDQGRWQHGEEVGYYYPSGLEKTICKCDIYDPFVTRGSYMSHLQIVFSSPLG